jgi:glycosyltransferase involved in cell wall biosynthesis
MSTVCLSMIVKNETKILHECLDSVHPHIDYWVIVDTGSTDGTQEYIKQYFAEKGIPGELIERPWVNFGHNRTEALDLCAGKADYAWMIDADDRVVGGFKYPHGKNLIADAYAIKCGREGCVWWRNQIFKTGIGWKYVGVLHEYAHCDKQPLHQEKIEGDYYLEARTLGQERNGNVTPVEKYSKDAELLLEALKTDPTNSRYQFYLGQSYFDSQQWDKAIEAYYKRVEMGGWEEECYYSLFRIALCEISKESAWPVVQQKLLDAYDYRPCRAEPLHAIARFLRMNGRPRAAYLFAKEAAQIPYPQQDILFIDTNVYKWMALDELAATAFYVHDYRTGYAACEALLKQNRLPPSEVERNQKNHAAYLERLQQIEAAMPKVAPPPTPQAVPTATQSLLNTGAVQRIKSFKKRRK